jgi:glucose-1-phosphate cytidylyltransferase
MARTKTVIFCGGMGTRMRDASEQIPKPLLPIGGRPIVWHIMRGYAHHGFKDFVLCLGYKSWLFKEFFLNYRAMSSDLIVDLGHPSAVEFVNGRNDDWRVTLAETGEDTGTGGRLAAVRRYLDGEDHFMATYGDGVSDLDIRDLLAFHRSHGRVATVTAVRPPGRFGELRVSSRRVSEFNEKPQTSEGYINGGFFVFDAKRIWDYLPARGDLVLEAEPLQGLARDGELMAYEHSGFWQPMDTLREYNALNALWAGGRAPWKTWDEHAVRAEPVSGKR